MTDDLKSCCAAAYGSDAVALLLGESYHPGGLALTRRLAGALGLGRGQRVADIASGPGTTARLLAQEYGVTVDGVELGSGAGAERVPGVRFHVGDAERLPFGDGVFDAVVCECAFCLFADKRRAAAELARVLRPGGVAGITDVTVGDAGLPEALTTATAWVACLADARPLREYSETFASAGLVTRTTEVHDGALTAMVDQLDARLRLLRMTAPQRLADSGVDAGAVLGYIAQARAAAESGTLGYGLLVAQKPDR